MSDSYAATPASEPLVSFRRVTQLAFVLLLALVVARATMSEFGRDPFLVLPGQQYAPYGAGASTIVVVNLLCWVPALLVLLRRGADREYRLSGIVGPLLWVATGALALASCAWASDKFTCVLAASTWISAGALCWASAQLVRSWARFRAVMAVVAGILLVYCAAGLYYRFVELPDTQAMVERTQDKILQERNLEPGSFQARQFLQKIKTGEMVGFGSSANTYAAMLVFGGVITAGLMVQGSASRRDPVLMFMLVAGVVGAVWCGIYAASKTAAATPAIAAALVGYAWWASRRAEDARGRLFIAGLAVVLLALAAVVGHGLYHGGLPGASLNFRWRYWVGSWDLFQAHRANGVGWGSFGESYLRYRVPAAAEEVKDPHNFLVRFATELGIVGLVGCVLWQLVSWWDATRPAFPERRRGLTIGARGLAAALVLGMALNVAFSIDFQAPASYVIIEMFKRCMYLGALIVGGALALIASKASAEADDTPSPWTLWAAGAAVAVFLLHNLVDFSLFENGPMVVVAMVFGAVMGARGVPPASEEDELGRSRVPVRFPRWAALAAAGCVAAWMLGFSVRVVGPVVSAEGKAWEGDDLLRRSRQGDGPVDGGLVLASAEAYEAAMKALPYNADYALRAARVWDIGIQTNTRDRELLGAALEADPLEIKAILQLARLDAKVGNLAGAVEHFGRAVELNPTDVEIRLDYAEALEHAGRTVDSRGQVLKALEYNDRLDPAEPKRLEPSRAEALRARASTRP